MKLKKQKKQEVEKLTDIQKKLIEVNAPYVDDLTISKMLGCTYAQVQYHRSDILRIDKYGIEEHDKKDIEDELHSLLLYCAIYNGSMRDSLEHRIKQLKSKL